jgi:rare lipoprotein A
MGIANGSFDSAAKRGARRLAPIALALSLAACVTANPEVATTRSGAGGSFKTAALAPVHRKPLPYFRAPHASPKSFDGMASFYSEGAQVATGAHFDPNGLTAAHRWLPFGTRVRVSDPRTGRSIVVTINDRGPFVQGRVLDLSVGAARALGIQDRGVSRVHGQVL